MSSTALASRQGPPLSDIGVDCQSACWDDVASCAAAGNDDDATASTSSSAITVKTSNVDFPLHYSRSCLLLREFLVPLLCSMEAALLIQFTTSIPLIALNNIHLLLNMSDFPIGAGNNNFTQLLQTIFGNVDHRDVSETATSLCDAAAAEALFIQNIGRQSTFFHGFVRLTLKRPANTRTRHNEANEADSWRQALLWLARLRSTDTDQYNIVLAGLGRRDAVADQRVLDTQERLDHSAQVSHDAPARLHREGIDVDSLEYATASDITSRDDGSQTKDTQK